MFEDREGAGKLLAEKLIQFANDKNALVLGVTRGGVIVAKEIAEKLNLPLDILVVKKIGLPRQPELAIGAVGPKKTVYWNENLIKEFKIRKSEMARLEREKQQERKEREKVFRQDKLPKDIKGKTIIVADDGVATGASAICAAYYLQKEGAAGKILAIPIISKDTLRDISKYFDMVISLKSSGDFFAVGEFYREFHQVDDSEVMDIVSGES